jgi:hypothetical protein
MTPAEREVYLDELHKHHRASLTRGSGIQEPEVEPKVRKRPRKSVRKDR